MIRSFKGKIPKIHPKAFVHPAAEVIGDVEIKAYASVWPCCVLRGDTDKIIIGERTNIQDGTVIHCDEGVPTILGKGVVVGHGVIIHGSKIADHVLVGMGATVLSAAIGSWTLIGARALILDGMRIPAKSVVLGSPAKIVRAASAKEIRMIKQGEKNYLIRQKAHRETSFAVEI
ncbi:MAG: gamma carbonic anhydrase family protein [Elusimicrobia bacterium]|nr:gamma carbonic anhydrase family protein [Elusimicrobiota bacterium]